MKNDTPSCGGARSLMFGTFSSGQNTYHSGDEYFSGEVFAERVDLVGICISLIIII